MRRRELAIGGAVVAAGLLLWLVLIPWQVGTLASQADEISPALFPQLLAGLLVVLGSIHLIDHSRRRATNAAPETRTKPRELLRAFVALGIGGLYVASLPLLGYLAATALAVAALVLHLGLVRARRTILVALPVALVLYLLFTEGLQVPLPRGAWMD